MKIGLPKALLYYRYGHLWEVFFREQGCEVVISGDTCKETLISGARHSVDENCLPLKVFMGHVQALAGRCDRVFVPRMERTGKSDEYCVRFWGLPDLVANTFPDIPLLTCSLDSGRRGARQLEWIKIGRALRKDPAGSFRAYCAGVEAQRAHDRRMADEQRTRFDLPGPKVLIAAAPYLVHDPYVGGPVERLIRRQGGVPIFSDRCDRARCRALSKELSEDLYWTLSKEAAGAILLHRGEIDGVILLTAFPCGTDSLVNELIMRKIKGIPLIQILLDEQQAEAGLETRVESFMDIVRQRRACREGA